MGFYPDFTDTWLKVHNWARRGCHGSTTETSREYKREAVAMLDAPGVTVTQIAAELGIGANMLGRWRRELRRQSEQAFVGNGRSRDEEMSPVPSRVGPDHEGAGFFARSGGRFNGSVQHSPVVVPPESHIARSFWAAGSTCALSCSAALANGRTDLSPAESTVAAADSCVRWCGVAKGFGDHRNTLACPSPE
jgi:hypothetical protein